MSAPGILGLNALDARHQHLLALGVSTNQISLPCGLPAELWSIILDHLFDDHKALLSCLLACRVWGDFCRYHLYEIFSWSYLDKFDEDACSTFHPHPRFVRRFVISGSLCYGVSPEETEWLLPLAQRLDQFVSVAVLEFDSFEWDDVIGTTAWDKFTAARNFLSQIKDLNLSNVPLQPFRCILENICLYPSLEKFDYLPSHVELDDDDTILDFQSYMPSRSWHTISTENAPHVLPTFGLWTWLSAITFTSLQTIRLDFVPKSDLPSLSNYLRLLGGVLKSFRIRFAAPRDVYDFLESNALANSTGLERLDLAGLLRQYNDDQLWAGEESFKFFTMLPSTSLSVVKFILNPRDSQGPSPGPSRLSAIDELLATSGKFSLLRNVHLRVGYKDEQHLSEALVLCHKRRLVTVSFRRHV
ncbi:hypothetical protein EV361DRAFT_310408 [Lentinula raphanica]|uniref:F-box domain-containing protein n=1 Tax=Lentinula raphanica TaxID=153919 RepID=A0AA38P2B7_9AGAR|nr:hypothetical protein F5878DRAFT_727832 [Lentinula raphanica]KAJ3970092.1 hypothetical protein EV361DRAFT_310408 [Lentinula raphanica]